MSLIQWSVERSTGAVESSALRRALAGAPEGTVVSRRREGADVEFSVILRPPPGSPVGLLRLMATFCTSEGIRKDTGIITWMRWPEGVVVEGKAIAAATVVFGPGSNPGWAVLTSRTNNRAVERGGETSIEKLLGTSVDDRLLMEKILESLAWMYYGFLRGMYPHILKRVNSMLDGGGPVEVTRGGRSIRGTVKGVDDLGRLVVSPEGKRRSLKVEFGEIVREL